MLTIILIFVCHWYIALFFQTFFHHRYASHKMFKMKPFTEKVFYMLTFLFQGSSFLNPAAYAVMHRNHHTHADTDKDPHSPQFHTNIFDFNKRTFVEYRKLVNQFLNNEISLTDVPRWPSLERIAESLFTRTLFILIYIGIYVAYAPSPWFYCLIPLHIFMGPIHGFIVNWYGHSLGYRNFKEMPDNSKNTLPIDLLMMGELYQNNHHKAPQKRNFAVRWFELDTGYLISDILLKLNLIQLHKAK
ncbi:MAG: fatty acid desaturase [Candidatus Marinimicrobia bacterium]|nr:fatty acid desaturase [Candidatus Neomarinimicrobiota bacterium]